MSTRVIRGNGERIVPDEKVAEYLAMGYSVIDAQGNVVRSPETNNPADLKKQIEILTKERDEARMAAVELAEKLFNVNAENETLRAALEEHHEAENTANSVSTPLEPSENVSTSSTPL